jgi:ATP-dependent Lon protease
MCLPQDDKEALVTKFQERLSARTVPEAIQKVIDEEIAKLNTLETASSEFNVTRYCIYLEVLRLHLWLLC